MSKEWTVYGIEYQSKIMYVGVSSNMKNRIEQHKYQRGTSYSAIPVDVDYHNVVFLTFETYGIKKDALSKEDELIRLYDTINNGWNKNRSGLVELPDKSAYMKEYQRQYFQTDEHKERRREQQLRYYYRHKEEMNKKRVEREKHKRMKTR